jgi:hypothetical protein
VRPHSSTFVFAAAASVSALFVSTHARAHDEPFVIGRTSASPARLAFDGPADILDGSECIELLPGDGAFAGMWVHDEPSFATLLVDRPDIDFLRLLPGHSLALRLVAADAPLRFFEPAGFTPILTGPGSTFTFPTDPEGNFEIHLLGGSAEPGMHAATFQFTDLSGTHLDSDQFTICFQTVPTPTSVILPAFAALAAFRRRRS